MTKNGFATRLFKQVPICQPWLLGFAEQITLIPNTLRRGKGFLQEPSRM